MLKQFYEMMDTTVNEKVDLLKEEHKIGGVLEYLIRLLLILLFTGGFLFGYVQGTISRIIDKFKK